MGKRGNKEKTITYDIDENGCHNSTSHACNGDGYPYIKRNGVRWRLSRYVFTLNKGRIPKGKIVRHTCDNRKCINPKHLILGTLTQNNRDRAVRNRSRDQNGSNNNMAKLNENQVVEIYKSNLTNKELASNYNISKKCNRNNKGEKILVIYT